MKLFRLILLGWLFHLDSQADVLFVGVMRSNSLIRVALEDSDSRSSEWVQKGDRFRGYRVMEISPPFEVVKLERGGVIFELRMQHPKIESPGDLNGSSPDEKEVSFVGTLQSFTLDVPQPTGSRNWDSLVFTIDSPQRLKGRNFSILVYFHPDQRSAEDRKKAESYWNENIGMQVERTVQEGVLFSPEPAPCVLACPKGDLHFKNSNQSLEATAPGGRGRS